MKIKLKRLTSLMLAVLMVCGMFPMPSFAAGSTVNMTPNSVIYDADGNKEQETSNKNAALSDGQVILTKHAEATNTPNQYMITLTVRGKGIQSTVQGADIVLVMDKSGSMGTNGMTALKKAAETFLDTVLADGKGNRVSLVNYSTTSGTATDFYTSAQRTTAKGKIPTKADGGTNTQMALYTARQKLATSTASKKFIVLISDGEPTFNAIPIINAKWNGNISNDTKDYGARENYVTFKAKSPTGNGKWSKVDSSKSETTIVGYDYSMMDGNGGNTDYEGYALGVLASDTTQKLAYTKSKLDLSSSTAAIYEAGLIKAAGTEVYTVAYKADKAAQTTLSSIATTNTKDKTYTYTTDSDLEKVFKSIGDSINESISGGVADPMGAYIDIGTPSVTGNLVNADKGSYKVSNGQISFKENTFTWLPNVGEAESTLSYIVELDVEAPGFIENQPYETNGTTTLEYKLGENGTTRTGEFNVPTVAGTYSQVYRIGYRVNEAGKYIDAYGKEVDKAQAVIFAKEGINNDRGVNQWKKGRDVTVNAFADTDQYKLVSASTVVFNDLDGVSKNNVAEFNYVVKTYGYTVNYYMDSKANNPFKTETGSGELGVNIPYDVAGNVPAGYKSEAAVENADGKVTVNTANNVVNIIYSKMDDLSYVVNYLEQGTNKVLADANTVNGQEFGANVTETAINITGYNLVGENQQSITIDVENNVINFYYTKKSELSYVVKYLEKGTLTALADEKTVGNKTYGETVTEDAIAITGYNLDGANQQSIVIDVENNVITFLYTKKSDLSYTVNYYEQGTTNKVHESKTVNNKTFGEKVSESAVEVFGYTAVAPTSAEITIIDGENVINFYYNKRTDLKYTVEYLDAATRESLRADKKVTGQKFGAEVTEYAVVITGYNVVSANSYTVTINKDNMVITFLYAKKNDLTYVVNYYLENTTTSLAPSKTENGQEFGASITESAIDITGYVKVGETEKTITIAEEGNVINFYYKPRTDLTYVVYYLEKDTGNALAGAKYVDHQTFGESVTEQAIDIAGYDKLAPTSETITIAVEGNEITFWYAKRTDLKYVVNYLEKGTNNVLHAQKVVENNKYRASVTEEAIDIEGYVKVDPTTATITINVDEAKNVINFWYEKRSDLSYVVNYLEQGTNNVLHAQKVVENNKYLASVTEEAIDITGYVKVDPTTATITINVDEAKNVINFWYEKRSDLSYVVNYLEQGTNNVLHAQKVVENNKYLASVTEEAIDITGYNKVAPTSETITIKVEGNVINFFYNKRNDLSYVVKYLEQGTNNALADEVTVSGQTYGAVVTEEAIAITGYDLVSDESQSITIDVANNEIIFWYAKKASLSYTVNYYEEGTTNKVAASKVENNQVFGAEITEEAIDVEGYNKVGDTIKSITIVDGTNEINFYYNKRNDLVYTVNYLEQGTNAVLAEAKTAEGQTFGASVTETA
ncbi:MAG: VWA domain-containing protein, partial [Clostridia bacterium]|nr:VWA domain-containing protein [Clostridia bacterium]